MNIPRPLGARVVIKPTEGESVTHGGIILPENAKKETQRGTILAVGPGAPVGLTAKVEEIPLRIGDEVLYAKWGVTEFETEDRTLYLILKAEDVLAVVAEAPEPAPVAS